MLHSFSSHLGILFYFAFADAAHVRSQIGLNEKTGQKMESAAPDAKSFCFWAHKNNNLRDHPCHVFEI